MSFKLYVLTNQLIRDLTRLAKNVEDYPKTKLGKPRVTILYKNNETFRKILEAEVRSEWNKLGPAFTQNSKPMRQLVTNPGSGSGRRGVAAYQVGFKNTEEGTKAFKIADIWDRGGTIYPRNVQYLAQPFSHGRRLETSPRQYDTDKGGEYTAFVGKDKPNIGPSDSRVTQDVHRMLYIRERKTGYAPSKKGKKIKRPINIVASFLLLKSQTHKPTRWVGIAAARAREKIAPLVVETGRQYIRSQKVLS